MKDANVNGYTGENAIAEEHNVGLRGTERKTVG